jgi:Fe2+ or Zn2+ uptake regulation protein
LATIYRNLNQLVEDKKLTKIKHALKGTLYEISGKSPHHYLFCTSCDTTFEKPGCGLSTCIEELKEHSYDGFIVQSHEVYLHGICPNCAK